jgi:hypothetical protein
MRSDDRAGGEQAAPQVGKGAVLYDTRDPEQRPCCSMGGRCLAHVTRVYEEIEHGDRLYVVWDGTHTTREHVSEERLLAAFERAGWRWPVALKPTYHLTRQVGVHDNHDLMLEANQ